MIIDSPGAVADKIRRQPFVEVDAGRRRAALAGEPVASSAGGPWRGFVVERHADRDGFDNSGVFTSDHLIVASTGPDLHLEWEEAGVCRSVILGPGAVIFIPAAMPFSCRSTEPGEFVGVALTPAFLRCAAHDMFPASGALAFQAQVPVKDAFLAGAVAHLAAEVDAGYPAGRSYGETLATAMAAHLVRRFAKGGVEHNEAIGARLSRQQLRLTLEYIREHLAEEVSLATLADQAGLSPYHFCRVFKQTTGLSPHRYLISQRVERAREMLLEGGTRIAEVAVKVGFCDQSHLTAHFKRAYGVTPREFRLRAFPGTPDA